MERGKRDESWAYNGILCSILFSRVELVGELLDMLCSIPVM